MSLKRFDNQTNPFCSDMTRYAEVQVSVHLTDDTVWQGNLYLHSPVDYMVTDAVCKMFKAEYVREIKWRVNYQSTIYRERPNEYTGG